MNHYALNLPLIVTPGDNCEFGAQSKKLRTPSPRSELPHIHKQNHNEVEVNGVRVKRDDTIGESSGSYEPKNEHTTTTTTTGRRLVFLGLGRNIG